MLGYIIRRALATIPVLLVVSIVVFGLSRLAPGDPAVLIAGHEAQDWEVEALREQLG